MAEQGSRSRQDEQSLTARRGRETALSRPRSSPESEQVRSTCELREVASPEISAAEVAEAAREVAAAGEATRGVVAAAVSAAGGGHTP